MQLPCQQHAAVTWMLLMQGVILLIGIALTGLGWSNPIRDVVLLHYPGSVLSMSVPHC